jgi:Tfp pilus assembly protein PilV
MLSARLTGLALDERGFGLVEMMVALVMGVIVIGALFAILGVSLHQTAAISDNVQSNRQGRTVMTKIVNELHSACLAPDFAPIQTGSSATELRFVNAYSKEAVILNTTAATAAGKAAEAAYEHRIKYEEPVAGSNQGRLVDYTYPSTSTSSWPKFTFSEPYTKRIVLAESIFRTEEQPKTKEFKPIFEYFKYGPGSLPTTEGFSALTALGSAPEGAQVAAVRINFTSTPEDTRFQAPLASSRVANERVPFSSLVTFAFSPPNAETPTEAAPCE